MNSGKTFIKVLFILVAILAVAFFSFFAIVKIPVDVGKPLKIPGETYFLVKKPNIMDPVYIDIGVQMNSTVWGSIANFFTLREVKLPWYMEKEYISKNAYFCYNTVAGVIIDKTFFEKPFK
jgi:hypothetical protein